MKKNFKYLVYSLFIWEIWNICWIRMNVFILMVLLTHGGWKTILGSKSWKSTCVEKDEHYESV